MRRVRLNVDVTGFRPSPGQLDKYGNEIPDKLYTPQQYERIMILLERTDFAASYLTEHLKATDRMAKTIVFCENNDHAHRMRMALTNANADLMRDYPNYVARRGIILIAFFTAVTSRLLTTGLDLPAVRNIVIFRRIASMPEFKQVIGRGTRLCPEIGKGSFDIVDFVEATVLFNDPSFDGPPLRIQTDEADDNGHVTATDTEPGEAADDEEVAEPGSDYQEQDGGSFDNGDEHPDPVVGDADLADQIRASGRRLYVDGVDVYKWGEAHYRLDGDGRTMRLITYRQWVHDRVIGLDLTPGQLRAQWAQVKSREVLVNRLAEADIEVEELAAKLENPDVDTVDLLLGVAWGLPLVSREERALRVRREQRAFLASFAADAQEVLNAMLSKFVEYGATELSPRALQVPPISDLGTVTELAARFDGAAGLHFALDELGKRLFDVA